MPSRTFLVASLTAAVLFGAVSVAASEGEGPTQTAEEALRADAQAYAQAQGVPLDEAIRRLRLQEASADWVAQLRETHAGRLAGLYFEHSPEYRLVVRLTGQDPVENQTRRFGELALTTTFVTGAPATRQALLQSIDARLNALRTALPDLQGVHPDERTGEIVLTVHAAGAAAAAALARRPELASLLGHPVRIETIAAPLEPQHTRGGGPTSTCTTAFSVHTSGGTYGVLTAGHCGNAQTYYGYDGSNYAMTFQSERWDADQDVQWHTALHETRPEFYADLTTSARILTGRRLQSSTSAGNHICHRGRTSGYSCGLVESTAYRPSWTCGPSTAPVTCANTYISVTGSGLACAGGDSGGPWFASQTAFGVHSGGSSSGSAAGQCARAIYMSTDRISDMGLSLFYGS